jgi:HEAT repeat protein
LLAEVKGLGAEEILLSALNDSNLEVKKTAVQCLGVIKSEKAFPVFIEILQNIMESPSEDGEQIENQIYWAVGFMDERLKHDGKTPEELLLEVLENRAQAGKISRLLGRKGNTVTEQAICTICDSLARIGTKISVPVLTELSKNKKQSWGAKAQQALEKIEKRRPDKEGTKLVINPSPSSPSVDSAHFPT